MCIKNADKEVFEEVIQLINNAFKNEFQTSDSAVNVTVKPVLLPETAMTEANQNALISLLRLIPNGVQTMSNDIPGLVESSNNIGVLITHDNAIEFSGAVRSSVKSLKGEINNRILQVCNLVGASLEFKGDYPEWEFKVKSPIRELMKETYASMNQKELKIDAIHAGLECGLLKEKVGDIDMISIGPNLYDVHTPNEHMSISSTRRVFEFLCEVLKRIK